MNAIRGFALSLGVLLGVAGVPGVYASDHSDAPAGGGLVRQDANITDLHAFVHGSNLVLAVSTNPTIPTSAASYVFPTDVMFEFNIDVDSEVLADDPFGNGGTVVSPQGISEEITFRVTFRNDGSARIQRFLRGVLQSDPQIVNFFAGLRDDPFIRAPRNGRNSGSMVMEIPLASIVQAQSTLLIWATAKVQEFDGPQQENAGRSLRSMFGEQSGLNLLHPKHHLDLGGFLPEVVIFDTSKPAHYPNGRALEDDVVDLACALSNECRVFNQPDEGPNGPTTNDVPFLATFPYLAPPHPAI